MSPGTEITTLLHVYEHLSSLPVVQFYFMLCRPLEKKQFYTGHTPTFSYSSILQNSLLHFSSQHVLLFAFLLLINAFFISAIFFL